MRYAAVTDRAGRGMLFEMDEKSGPMMFSALPYTPHELENAKHPYELPQVHYTVVRAALGQMENCRRRQLDDMDASGISSGCAEEDGIFIRFQGNLRTGG